MMKQIKLRVMQILNQILKKIMKNLLQWKYIQNLMIFLTQLSWNRNQEAEEVYNEKLIVKLKGLQNPK